MGKAKVCNGAKQTHDKLLKRESIVRFVVIIKVMCLHSGRTEKTRMDSVANVQIRVFKCTKADDALLLKLEGHS